MQYRFTRRAVALVAAAALALAGCGTDGPGGGGPAAEPTWPTLVDGELTDAMCGLLTARDYADAGFELLLPLEYSSGGMAVATNSVNCSAPLGNGLFLTLQPTAEAAGVWYRASLPEPEEDSFTEGVVSGADESWFGYDSNVQYYVLVVRRGSLIAELEVAELDATTEADARTGLTQLAGKVLERLPGVGSTDSGTTTVVTLQVTGTGPLQSLTYVTGDHPSVELENVALPWSVDLPMADRGDAPAFISLFATGQTTYPPPVVSCAILVNGKVETQDQGFGFATCSFLKPL